MNVKPAHARLIVRDPRTREPLPVGGKRVPNNSFWRRRLKAGDVVEVPEVSAPPAPPEPAPAAAPPPSPAVSPETGSPDDEAAGSPVEPQEKEEPEKKPKPSRKRKRKR